MDPPEFDACGNAKQVIQSNRCAALARMDYFGDEQRDIDEWRVTSDG